MRKNKAQGLLALESPAFRSASDGMSGTTLYPPALGLSVPDEA